MPVVSKHKTDTIFAWFCLFWYSFCCCCFCLVVFVCFSFFLFRDRERTGSWVGRKMEGVEEGENNNVCKKKV